MSIRESVPTIFAGIFVYCDTPKTLSIKQGSIFVSTKGIIEDIVLGNDIEGHRDRFAEKFDIQGKDIQVFHATENEFFFPGFIDTHIHAPQYPNSGVFGKTTLISWLQKYTYPMEASLSDIDKARRVYSTCVSRTIANGTTTASYYATIHVKATNLLASICKEKGQRALIGRVCMDSPQICPDYYLDKSLAEAMKSTMAVIEHIQQLDIQGDRIAPILTPRSCISCTQEFLLKLAELSKTKGYRLQTHLSENVDEIKLVHKIWPDAESYTHVYKENGLLTEKMNFAHAIHLSNVEQKLIAEAGSKISHCPVSNSALGSGICPVRTLIDAGITIGLGTDISGGYSPSILENVRHACLVSRLLAQSKEDDGFKLSIEEGLWMATRGGADVVGWKDRLGAFEIGMQWDAQLIKLDRVPEVLDGLDDDIETNVKIFGWESQEDQIAKWVYGGDDRNTRKVWVAGQLIHSKD